MKFLVAVLLVLAVSGATAKKYQGKKYANVRALIADHTDLNYFDLALTDSDIEKDLTDTKLKATIFAPDDIAFKGLFARELKDRKKTSKQLLADKKWLDALLKYHVVKGDSQKVVDLKHNEKLVTEDAGETLLIKVLTGKDLAIDQHDGLVGIDIFPTGKGDPDASIRTINADLEAGKTILHIIDEVLVPANVA